MSENPSERRTELYRKFIEKNRYRILNSLENASRVIRQLNHVGVIQNEERERLSHLPSLWIQKQKMLSVLLQKDFEAMEMIIDVLHRTNNQGLEYLFEFNRERVLKEYPIEETKPHLLPRSSIVSDKSKLPFEPSDPSGYRHDSETDPGEVLMDHNHLTIPMYPIPPKNVSIDLSHKNCPRCSFLKLFRAASEGDVDFLKKLLDSEHIERYEPCKACFKKTRGQTLLHAAVLAKNSTDVIECVELLISKLCGDVPDGLTINGEDIAASLLNRQDECGQTAIHLAAEHERSKVVEKLYHDYNCDILLKNNNGQTALDLINLYTPKVTWEILNKETLPVAKNNDSLDGNFTLEIDFGRIIGCPILNQANFRNRASDNYVEMRTLTKLVESNNTQAYYSLLSHIMVKTFLDLKWKKMSSFLYTYMGLKVALYFWYTLFVVNVFLTRCPISKENHYYRRGADFEDRTILDYLVGGWQDALQALTGYYDTTLPISPDGRRKDSCNFHYNSNWQPMVFFVLGILLLIKDTFEAIILSNVQTKRQQFLAAYWDSWEDRFQLVFNLSMILIGTLAFRTHVPDYYYTYASLSIVVVWALIFVQVGYLLGQGMYVQLLGKIIKRFGTLMINYLCWIIAFSIALSILFPHDKPFETLPKSFLRVITMMSGELNYENTFYGPQANVKDGEGTETHEGPVSAIVFTAHIIYISLAVLLTIIMSNALIGLVVSDVHDLHERSEVLLRSIQVNKMYTMEVTLLKLRRVFPCLRGALNIFVIHPKDIWKMDGDGMPTGNGMVLKISIKNTPETLQAEIREFALNPEAYKFKGWKPME